MSSKPMSRVSLPAIPVAGQLPGTGSRPVVATANSRAPSGAAAVTSARGQARGPERYCLRPETRQPPAVRAAVRPGPGGIAAQTPHRLPGPGAGPPSSARIATASACPSPSRTRDRSSAARPASRAQRSRVRPLPGRGRSSRPDSTAPAKAAAVARHGGGLSKVTSPRAASVLVIAWGSPFVSHGSAASTRRARPHSVWPRVSRKADALVRHIPQFSEVFRLSRLEQAGSLDRVVTPAQRVARRLRPGPARDALNGVWLGHPLHPVLAQAPVGAWLSAAVLDAARGHGGRPGGARGEAAAAGAAVAEAQRRRLVAFGLAAAAAAALAGAADWSEQH